MANTRSAAKRARQTVKITLQNKRVLTALKNQVKKTRVALSSSSDHSITRAEVIKTASAADKAAKSGRIHKNAANRMKSRLNKRVAALTAAPAAA